MMAENNLNVAVVGNCSINALVDQRAKIVFSCLPRFDSDPMFCYLLSGGGNDVEYGFWDIILEGFSHSHQEYEKNTAIVRTKLYAVNGASLEVVDLAPRFEMFGRSFHPTTLIRMVKPLTGHPRITIRCRPAFNYGEKPCETLRGSNHIAYFGKDFTARLTTDAPTSFVMEEIPFVVMEEFGMIFGPNEPLLKSPRIVIRESYEQTREYWYQFTRQLKIPFEWQQEVIRAAISLKLCSYEESGAILAALTTSIPESPNSGRNWDYRFHWLRDAYHTVKALNYLGATETMEDYIRFIVNVVSSAKSGDLQPLYGLLMQEELPESLCQTLKGYRGMGPVRKGNDAYFQIQNDNYGSVILAVCQMFFDERIQNPASEDLFEQLEHIGHLAVKSFNQPDAGLWELRGSLRVHTFSSVMCWAGCDRLAKIASKIGLSKKERFWIDQAAMIREYVLDNAWDADRQTFTSVIGDEASDVDSALLLLPELGFIEAKDERFIKTVERIEKNLKFGDFLYRYVEEDDFGKPENAFVICTFWYINALSMIGRQDEARQLFQHILRYRNHVGLLSEDIDVHTKELWGNFPQTYSMVGLINSAIRLSIDWSDAGLC